VKNFLMIMGGEFITLIVAAIRLIGSLFFVGRGLDDQSKAYSQKVLPPLLSDLTVDKFFSYVHPDDVRKMNESEMRKYIDLYRSRLGEYQSSHAAVKCNANVNFTGIEPSISAVCLTKAGFKNGIAKIRLLLKKRGKEWNLNTIGIFSDALIAPMEAK
jgi:hypothetical protein